MELHKHLSALQFSVFINGKQIKDTTVHFDSCDIVFTDGSSVQIQHGFKSIHYIITSFSHD